MNPSQLKVAWLASDFIYRQASGTAYVAVKLIEKQILSNINVTLLVKKKEDIKQIRKVFPKGNFEIEVLPSVNGVKFATLRQFYKYCWIQKSYIKFDILHIHVPRLVPFFWLFPSRKFIATFHAGGEKTAPVDKFVLSRHIYFYLTKFQSYRLDRIYAVSNFALREIMEVYKCKKEKVHVLNLGVEKLWNVKDSGKYRDLKTHNSKKIILIQGRWQKYKNLYPVLEALSESSYCDAEKYTLIILAKTLESNLKQKSEALAKLSNANVISIEYLEECDLVSLYRSVDLVIFPSINEGFGFSAFEAFGEGCKLLVSENTPAAEILGNFNGVMSGKLTDAESILDCIGKAFRMSSENLISRREKLEKMGYTWDCANDYLLKEYEKTVRN